MTASELRLDYFLFYDVGTKVAAGQVGVRGPFDSRRVAMHLSVLDHFATPVVKNGEPLHDRHAHLVWYRGVQPPEPARAITLKHQFGTLKIRTGVGQGLLVPTQKIGQGSQYPDALDHYKAYRLLDVDSVQKTSVSLRDEFGASRVRMLAPFYFAVPVDKRHGTKAFKTLNARAHLLIYAITTEEFDEPTSITIWNQFDKRQSVSLSRAVMLAAPSVMKQWSLA